MADLNTARRYAEEVVEAMRPFCERISIAGSIRREKSECRDVEVVAIPRWGYRPGTDLFGEEVPINRLHEWALRRDGVRWIKPGVAEVVDWTPKPDGKYWRGILNPAQGGLKLDVFLCGEENWGAIFLIRTGASDFSKAVVTRALQLGKPCRDGMFTVDGEMVVTPEEADVFALLGLRYVEPQERTGPEALRHV